MADTATYDVEWFVPEPNVVVRQGDLLINGQARSGGDGEICLVITADCDISKGKFGRQLACLRVVRLHEYIDTVWAGKKLEKVIKDEADKARGQVAKWHTKLLGVESTLTVEGAVAWICREEPASLAETLGVPEGERKKLIAAITAFRDALTAAENSVSKGKLAQLVEFRAAIRKLEIKHIREETLQQAQKESLPEDTFLLPSLPQIEAAPAVVLLREIVGIPYEAVHYRATDAQSSDAFLRIGRLQPMFKYAISQAFGTLYARIGLSQAYEARCKGAIENISTFAWE
jgi:hypothetical protein